MTVTVPRPAEAPVLVGRARELGALVDAVTRSPSVAMVEGEAGIGKTRLIREALRDPAVRGRRVLLGVLTAAGAVSVRAGFRSAAASRRMACPPP